MSSGLMQARIATSARAFTERFWREDLAHWDDVVKPGAIAAHLAVQAVDPAELSDDDLAEHVGRCGTTLRRTSSCTTVTARRR